jgi:hypothetical protein
MFASLCLHLSSRGASGHSATWLGKKKLLLRLSKHVMVLTRALVTLRSPTVLAVYLSSMHASSVLLRWSYFVGAGQFVVSICFQQRTVMLAFCFTVWQWAKFVRRPQLPPSCDWTSLGMGVPLSIELHEEHTPTAPNALSCQSYAYDFFSV